MSEDWRLSKSVPVTVILTIAMQSLGLVWYVSNLDASVAANAREIARQEILIMDLEKTSQMQAVMLGRIDENIKAIRMVIESRSDG